MKIRFRFVHWLALNGMIAATFFAQAESRQEYEPDEAPPRIEDNSFLIEEAYNQEAGIVQHIQTFQYMRDDTWAYTFTQEWPVPNQKHQLSYTIPFTRPDASSRHDGLGDVMINYRYQAIASDRLAFSPRLSLILPTGEEKDGLGNDAIGFQTNMPVSLVLSKRWTAISMRALHSFPTPRKRAAPKPICPATISAPALS